MSPLKNKINTMFKSKKINVFLLSLVMSFVILFFSKLSKTRTNTVSFKIEKINVPEDHVILNDSNKSLNITLKTVGFKLLPFYIKKPKIAIDFGKNIDRNDTFYMWNNKIGLANIQTQLDSDLDIISISPDTIKFKYDKNLVKKVPVILNSEINFTPGFDINGIYKLEPDSIKIIGPKKLVSKIEKVLTKEVILKDVKANIFETVALQLPDSIKDLKFTASNVKLTATIDKFTEGQLKIPVVVKNIPEGISLKYYPKEVIVSYYCSLSDFKDITAKDFIIVCDYAKVDSEHAFLVPEIIEKPKSVKSTRIGQNRIEFIIAE